jgi:hypothetical protein
LFHLIVFQCHVLTLCQKCFTSNFLTICFDKLCVSLPLVWCSRFASHILLLQDTLSCWSTSSLWTIISNAQWKNMDCHWHHCENFVMLVMNQHVLNQSRMHWLFHDTLHLTITLDNQCQDEVEIRGLKHNLNILCN